MCLIKEALLYLQKMSSNLFQNESLDEIRRSLLGEKIYWILQYGLLVNPEVLSKRLQKFNATNNTNLTLHEMLELCQFRSDENMPV